ncbi:MAG: hypothetical protein HJJLKODD_00088 [Phycisphaerae bacterium]|nr:hypothetical protein [Phycisphaerae bacterium]
MIQHNQLERDRSEEPGLATATLGDWREYVPVVFAADPDFAEEIKTVLAQGGIPTLIEGEELETGIAPLQPRRIAVLVPEEWHEEATELVLQLEQELQAGFEEEEEEEEFEDDDEYFDDEDELEDDFGDEEEDEDLFEEEEEEL